MQCFASETHDITITSCKVGLLSGAIVNIFLTTSLLSKGNDLNNPHEPRTFSVTLCSALSSPSLAILTLISVTLSVLDALLGGSEVGRVFGLSIAAKSANASLEREGDRQGKRRRIIQAYMMARDHTSAFWGSWGIAAAASGDIYEREPTKPE